MIYYDPKRNEWWSETSYRLEVMLYLDPKTMYLYADELAAEDPETGVMTPTTDIWPMRLSRSCEHDCPSEFDGPGMFLAYTETWIYDPSYPQEKDGLLPRLQPVTLGLHDPYLQRRVEEFMALLQDMFRAILRDAQPEPSSAAKPEPSSAAWLEVGF